MRPILDLDAITWCLGLGESASAGTVSNQSVDSHAGPFDSPLTGTVLWSGALSLRESAMSRKDDKLAHFDPDVVSDIIDGLAPEVQSWFADTVFEPIPEELAVILRRMDNDG